jgi:hypothetical protein
VGEVTKELQKLRERLLMHYRLTPYAAQAVTDLVELSEIIEVVAHCDTNTAVLAAVQIVMARG